MSHDKHPLRHGAHAAGRQMEKQLEIEEAESAKPLQSRRTNSPAEAKREMERARAEIQATVGLMKSRVEAEVEEAKRRVVVPGRIRERVRRDPWRTLAVAAATGLGLALLTAGGKHGYDTLTKDEIDEIRAWRRERRRHLKRLESLMEQSAATSTHASLRQRIRARLAARREE
jgi:ElaB/YqjD/DUF883 family membrane-anchored ribosome-binding protein